LQQESGNKVQTLLVGGGLGVGTLAEENGIENKNILPLKVYQAK
jgi:hypothetical protein